MGHPTFEVLRDNFATLANVGIGTKLCSDKNNRITVDQKVWGFVTLGRKVWGFDVEALKVTYNRAIDILRAYCVSPEDAQIKAMAKTLSDVYAKTLTSVYNLSKTYEAEKKEEMKKSLLEIYNTALANYNALPANDLTTTIKKIAALLTFDEQIASRQGQLRPVGAPLITVNIPTNFRDQLSSSLSFIIEAKSKGKPIIFPKTKSEQAGSPPSNPPTKKKKVEVKKAGSPPPLPPLPPLAKNKLIEQKPAESKQMPIVRQPVAAPTSANSALIAELAIQLGKRRAKVNP
jgi:hypothetical protein